MVGRYAFTILLILAAAAPAAAESYKWVDDNGVVNYSNTPPPEKFAKAKRVVDRISVMPSDPSLGAAVAAMNARAAQRAYYDEADWQARQRYMAMARIPAASPYGTAYNPYGMPYDPYATPYYPLYVPVLAVRSPSRFLRVSVHR
ncbi:MAG TPA: DUF4124 domain-containing protein [Burkholderiales bacterium]|nr:DUF4124 domain-containing protein [Burkholderiales bacterium]